MTATAEVAAVGLMELATTAYAEELKMDRLREQDRRARRRQVRTETVVSAIRLHLGVTVDESHLRIVETESPSYEVEAYVDLDAFTFVAREARSGYPQPFLYLVAKCAECDEDCLTAVHSLADLGRMIAEEVAFRHDGVCPKFDPENQPDKAVAGHEYDRDCPCDRCERLASLPGEDEDEGCPVGDHDCTSRDDECHDACEAPAR